LAEVRRHNTLALLQATSEAARFDSTSWVGSTTCPRAVIVTMDDRVVPAAHQHAMARALGLAAVTEIAGDHFACVKRPTEFNDALLHACAGLA
jgi:pimeloyl-ACP methyl ester carboxylesterase